MNTITVFTPTYNRAYCLHQVYESLLRQTSKDFCWLVIDDGSVDNTKELVKSWIDEGKVEIQYHYKENGGMHTGHNVAYSMINTELNVCIDSDDYMPDEAIEMILNLWKCNKSDEFAGIIGLDTTKTERIIGTKFPETLKKCKYSALSPVYGVVGDKKIIYRTDVVKQYSSYPTFENEKFVPLYLPIVIDRDYDLLCFNEIFCIVDYLDDGSTRNIYNQYFKNPNGFKHSRIIEMEYFMNKKNKFKSAIHFVSSKLILKDLNFFKDTPSKLYTFFAIPFGMIWYLYISSKKKSKRDIKKYVE